MRQFIAFVAIPLILPSLQAQSGCIIQRQEAFAPQHKTVALVSNPSAPADAPFVLFKSELRVNTDGAPNSYHPDDPRGQTKAINNIANAISVMHNGRSIPYKETIAVFEYFRNHDWTPPTGYKIIWQNVLAARGQGSREIPCVFTSGTYKGYFGSLTALKNNLSGDSAGECGVANQLDERFVPALVIAGGENPLKHFGVRTGDLLIAINPKNGAVQPGVVGDSGPADNLGEGSIALNMSLLKATHQPTNYFETKRLDTGSQEIIVAIIPKSAAFKLQRPYNAENIRTRVADWLGSHGYGSPQIFSVTAKACAGIVPTM